MTRLCAILATLALALCAKGGSARPHWIVYYADKASPEAFQGYDLVVLDSDRHPPVRMAGAKVLGYLSLVEVTQDRRWFGTLRDSGMLLGEQPNWGSRRIEIGDARWRQMVSTELVPSILAQGFDGLFLDTLDDAAAIDRKDAAVELVREIRRVAPRAILMVNRGYDILPRIVPYIDVVLGESVYGTYDFASKSYRAVAAADYRWQVDRLMEARKAKPGLRICTLDYWDPGDRDGIRRAYAKERSNGFDPYVTTIALDQVSREPR